MVPQVAALDERLGMVPKSRELRLRLKEDDQRDLLKAIYEYLPAKKPIENDMTCENLRAIALALHQAAGGDKVGRRRRWGWGLPDKQEIGKWIKEAERIAELVEQDRLKRMREKRGW